MLWEKSKWTNSRSMVFLLYACQVRMVHEWLGGLNPIIAVNVFKRLYCRRLMHAVEEIWLLCFRDIACEVFLVSLAIQTWTH